MNNCHHVWAKKGQPGEERVGQNRQRQRPCSAEAIANPPEEPAA